MQTVTTIGLDIAKSVFQVHGAPVRVAFRARNSVGASSRAPARPGVVEEPGMCRRSLRLGVDVKRVTDEAHFTDDLGADWLVASDQRYTVGC
jgi:hypothetical protein